MLFIEGRVADVFVNHKARIALLEGLQERGLVPLIRSSRLHCFEQALLSAERARELEQSVAAQSEAEGETPYVRGDVFCFDGFAHYLVFGDAEEEGQGRGLLRAGIIYEAETPDASHKLDVFCRHAQETLESASRGEGGKKEGTSFAGIEWRGQTGGAFARSTDVEGAETDIKKSLAPAVVGAEQTRAVEILEDVEARAFLQRLTEAYADGRVAEASHSGSQEPAPEALVGRLAGAGLARREVQVSCRQSGRSIFRLPSPDALAIVTASNAVCSECGAAVADERAEELVTPTPLASTMLKDGAWLAISLRAALAGAGVPAGEITSRSATEGDPQLMAVVCGEPFLFVLRDGDFTATHARRALEAEAEAQAAHLAIVATGRIQDEARARLREHARRRSRTGDEVELILAEGVEAASAELRHAAERISRRALARELYELDASAGFNIGYMLAARFRLTQKPGALKDLAASAASALAGSLRDL